MKKFNRFTGTVISVLICTNMLLAVALIGTCWYAEHVRNEFKFDEELLRQQSKENNAYFDCVQIINDYVDKHSDDGQADELHSKLTEIGYWRKVEIVDSIRSTSDCWRYEY